MGHNSLSFTAIVGSIFILVGNGTLAETTLGDTLISLAHKKFTNFASEKERKAFEKFFQKTQDGEKVDFTPEVKTMSDPLDMRILTDPAYAGLWEKDRVVQAGVAGIALH